MQLNGNLTLNANGASEVQNFIVERLSTAPSVSANEKGRIYFNTTDAIYYYNSGTIWQAFATGGSATTLSNEITALESSIGPLVNSSGVWISNGQSFSNVSNPSSLTNVLYQLDQAITADDEFSALKDVNLSSLSAGQVPQYNTGTSKWVNHTLVLADISDVTSTASEVNELAGSGVTQADLIKLHAVTATAANLNILTSTTTSAAQINYLDSLTSNVQTQLNGKQPLTTVLTNISSAGVASTADNVLVSNADGTFTYLTGAGFQAALGLVIGTDVEAWNTNLDQLGGFVTGANSSETETINGVTRSTGTVENVFIVGSGNAVDGDYWTLLKGAAARTALGLGDIAFLDSADFIGSGLNGSTSNVAANINWNGFQINNMAPGTSGTDAINLNQLEAAIQGLSWKQAVTAATTANITLSGTQTIDGIVLSAGERVLVKNQTGNLGNGIYTVATGAWTIVTDFSTAADADGAAVYVIDGTVQGGTGWTVTGDVTVAPGATTAISWTQFNGASGLTAGTGLTIVGNTLSVVYGAGITANPTGDVGIDLYSSTSALILTHDGASASNTVGAGLHLHLDNTTTNAGGVNVTGQLVQSVAGLRITSNTISEYELTASVAGNGLTGGNGAPLALVTASGTPATGGDTPANWNGVGTLNVTANAVGVTLGSTATSAAPGNHTHKASAITYSNAGSPITGSPTNVQDALNDIQLEIVGINSTAGTLSTQVTTFEASVGGITSGTGEYSTPFGSTNYITGDTSISTAIIALDSAVYTQVSDITAAVKKMYFLYTASTAGTSWVVTHSLGQKYCNVTIVDATDNVIIPQSIVFTDANNLTVTFNTSVAGKAVVMGLNPSAVF